MDAERLAAIRRQAVVASATKTGTYFMCSDIVAVCDHIDALQADNDLMRRMWSDPFTVEALRSEGDEMEGALHALQAENERLRAGLKECVALTGELGEQNLALQARVTLLEGLLREAAILLAVIANDHGSIGDQRGIARFRERIDAALTRTP